MRFQDMMNGIIEQMEIYSKRHNVVVDKEFAAIKLFEEVGEFAQAFLIHEKKSRAEKFMEEAKSKEELEKELADVVGLAVVNAKLHGIDLETAIRRKWLKEEV